MQFIDVVNPYGLDACVAPTQITVKPHKLPKTRKGVRVLRAPKPLTTVLRTALLTFNG